jgi:hypothetical protein
MRFGRSGWKRNEGEKTSRNNGMGKFSVFFITGSRQGEIFFKAEYAHYPVIFITLR